MMPMVASGQPVMAQMPGQLPPVMAQVISSTPMAQVGLDLNRDGRADVYVTGQDDNRNGIPDQLEQPARAQPAQARVASSRWTAPGAAQPSSAMRYTSAPMGAATSQPVEMVQAQPVEMYYQAPVVYGGAATPAPAPPVMYGGTTVQNMSYVPPQQLSYAPAPQVARGPSFVAP